MICIEDLHNVASVSGSSAADRSKLEPRGGSSSEETTNNCKTIQAHWDCRLDVYVVLHMHSQL